MIDLDSDKKLTVKYLKPPTLADELILESLAILLNRRELNRLVHLKFKELENFLRDDNHTPAFDFSDEKSLELIFDSAKKALILKCLLISLPKESPLSEIGFIAKLRLVNFHFKKLTELFELNHTFKFVFFEHEYLYYSREKDIEFNYFEEVATNFFQMTLASNIKLVAVYS
jgi:hypothetical protein